MKTPEIPTDPESLNQLSKSELVQLVIDQQKMIEELKQEIAKLKISRDLDSQTSSKPPSTDLLKKAEKESTETEEQQKSKRKPGGQPGHTGKTRKGFDRIDRYDILRPEKCQSCQNHLFEDEPVKVETQQVAQLVENPIEIVEYHRHHCLCRNCGAVTATSWPSQIIPGQDLGVRLQAFLGWLGNYGHLPYEKQQELLWELGKIEMGVGTLVTTNQRVESAINPSIEELSEWIRTTQPNIHVDETPWPVKGIKEWLWVFATSDVCLFHAGDTRSRAELIAVLGSEYSGVMSSDDLNVYNGYSVAAQQKCLAHLRRHFKRLLKLPGKYNQAIAQAFLKLIDEAFERYRDWQLTKNELSYRTWGQEFKNQIEKKLKQYSVQAGYEAGKLLRSLKEKAAQWWYFLDHPEVPPDNNLAERSLRLAVTKRKVSGGSRSMKRFEHTANLLSVVQTCRRQKRSVISFFEQALMATAGASEIPTLII